VGKTPFEAWQGLKPDIRHLRVFGCLAFIRIPKEKRRKWDSQAIQGIFIGYCSTTKQYRVYDPVTARLHTSRDVVFRENDRYALPQQTGSVSKDITFFEYQDNDEDWSIQRRQMVLPAEEPTEEPLLDLLVEEPEIQVQPRIARSPRLIINKPAASAKTERSLLRELKGLKEGFVPGMSLSESEESGSGRSHRRTRSEYRQVPPGEFSGMIMAAISGPEPRTYKEAMSSENSEEWKTACEKKIDAFEKFEVWEDSDLPEGRKAIPCQWVFRLKMDDIFKARIVCRGDLQTPGIDFNETFAPTARLAHVRLALAIAARYNLDIQQMDVCSAFLGALLEEEIYVTPPPGYGELTGTAGTGTAKGVKRLLRSLHGLKQAPRVWYGTIKDFLVTLGFVVSKLEGGFFILRQAEHERFRLLMVIYVHDLLLIGEPAFVSQIKEEMKRRFDMHDLGAVDFYLGMKIERGSGFIDLSQSVFINTILHRFGMQDAKPVGTPMDAKLKLQKRGEEEATCDKELYQSMLGSVMYAMTGTRPDICFAVGMLGRYAHDPSESHMVAMKRLLRYLAETVDWKLRIGSADGSIQMYADADYAKCADDFHSTSGYVLNFGGAIDWKSKKQKSVAQSTTDAEYYAFGTAAMRLSQVNYLLDELGYSDIRPVIYGDNQSAIHSIKNGIFRGTIAKPHIATKFFLASEMVRDGLVDLEYVKTGDMLADGLTKALPLPAHREFCKALGMHGSGL
jgi:hypothetical protein